MPFDFAELDIAEDPKPSETPVSTVQFTPPEQSESELFAAEMSEVEKRLEVASYYRLLLNDSLFTDKTAASVMVENEIRGFIRDRLAYLLNIKQEPKAAVPVELPFSKEELAALTWLASKVIANPKLKTEVAAVKPTAQAPVEKRIPTIKKVPASTSKVRPAHNPVLSSAPPTPTPTPEQPKRGPGRPRRGQYSPHAAPMPTGAAYEAMASMQASQASSSAVNQAGPIGAQMISGALVMPAKDPE